MTVYFLYFLPEHTLLNSIVKGFMLTVKVENYPASVFILVSLLTNRLRRFQSLKKIGYWDKGADSAANS
jgi:hypothetical protein